MIKNYVEDEKAIDKLLTAEEKLAAMKKLKAKKRRELGSYLGRKVKLNLFTRQMVELTTNVETEESVTGCIDQVDNQTCSLSYPSPDHLKAVGMFRIVSFEV